MTLNILYLGHDYGTSAHRADALRRLGHKVKVIDPWTFLPQHRFMKKFYGKLTYEIGPRWIEPYVFARLRPIICKEHFDVIWSDQCELIGKKIGNLLKKYGDKVVCYVVDDPFGFRDKMRFSLFKKSIFCNDLVAVIREPNVAEAYALGAIKVILVRRTADEIAHSPLVLSPREKANGLSDVSFIGTWMPERGPFIARLLELGVPVSIYGDRWRKAPEWVKIKKAWRGPGLNGSDYVKAIQCSKMCLGLLSKGNRDLHTCRSAEVPYIGSVLCAERTSEHLAMYEEDEEAVFWSTPEECAQKCFDLLADDDRRKRIAQAGRQRCINSGYLNEPVLQRILDVLYETKQA